MTTAGSIPYQTDPRSGKTPPFVYDRSFDEPGAEQRYAGPPREPDDAQGFMPDEATRDWTKRMHYAAWRTAGARSSDEAARWQRRYYDCRDRAVLGNWKLTFRAVQKWGPPLQWADDMVGECQLVLIRVVAAFNPWLGIRFSTYAFTCLMRTLSRLSQRRAADRLARAMPLEWLPGTEPSWAGPEEMVGQEISTLEEYFCDENKLLSPREKSVLLRRYRLRDGGTKLETLEQVGRALGLSKERVRQVQSSALGKLRSALLAAALS